VKSYSLSSFKIIIIQQEGTYKRNKSVRFVKWENKENYKFRIIFYDGKKSTKTLYLETLEKVKSSFFMNNLQRLKKYSTG